MPEIKLLDNQTIDKIAAGEVVEKPASVVKELVENAIDAGAKTITVEIKGGGIDLIRITDDGCGIPAKELSKAFLRHATSKINSDSDLFYLQTLGFRGEALASIAAVSQVEMITKTSNALTGTRIFVEGGEEKEIEEVGAPCGTTILVRNLFYNTPARKKFLKSAITEGSYIIELMQHMALSMPSMSFKLVVNNNVKFHTSGNADLKEVIYRIYGRDTINSLIPFNLEQNGISINGYLGKPELSRANRAFENYFVNKRYVRSDFISKAIEEGYKGFMMQHQFPFCVLHINIESTSLDVNVHPTKMQVRISNREELVRCLIDGIHNSLTGKEMIPEVKLVKEEVKATKIHTPEPFETQRLNEWKKESSLENSVPEIKENPSFENEHSIDDLQKHNKKELFFSDTDDNSETVISDVTEEKVGLEVLKPQSPFTKNIIIDKTEQLDLFENSLLTEKKRRNFNVLGQIFKTYWLIEFEDKLYVMDQHAAHEKVKYETFIKKYHDKEILSQNLSPAIVVTLSPSESGIYEEHKAIFMKFGFEIDSFGGNELMIRAIPLDLYGADPKEMFLAILEELNQFHYTNKIDIIEERIATMACKAAVKGNNFMTFQEISALLDQLLTLENPYHCPHGRPTMFSMSKYEIEKKFKRIV